MKNVLGVFACTLLAVACAAEGSRKTETEKRPDGSIVVTTTTTFKGSLLSNGGSVAVDAEGADITVNGPGGSTTTSPGANEEVPIPAGTESVDTSEAGTEDCSKCHIGTKQGRRTAIAPQHLLRSWAKTVHYTSDGDWDLSLFSEGLPGIAKTRIWSLNKQTMGDFVGIAGRGFDAPLQLPNEIQRTRSQGTKIEFDVQNGVLLYTVASSRAIQDLDLDILDVDDPSSRRTFSLRDPSTGFLTPGASAWSMNGWHFASLSIPVGLLPPLQQGRTIRAEPRLDTGFSSTPEGYPYEWDL